MARCKGAVLVQVKQSPVGREGSREDPICPAAKKLFPGDHHLQGKNSMFFNTFSLVYKTHLMVGPCTEVHGQHKANSVLFLETFCFLLHWAFFFFLVLLDNWLSIMFCDFVFLWVLVDFVFVCMRVCPYFFLVLFLSFLF